MLRFRYTCARQDEVRRKTLAWLSVRFPRMVLDHFNEDSCLGRKLEASGMVTAEVESIITELSKRVATDQNRETVIEPSLGGGSAAASSLLSCGGFDKVPANSMKQSS